MTRASKLEDRWHCHCLIHEQSQLSESGAHARFFLAAALRSFSPILIYERFSVYMHSILGKFPRVRFKIILQTNIADGWLYSS